MRLGFATAAVRVIGERLGGGIHPMPLHRPGNILHPPMREDALILLVEDRQDDAMLMLRSFARAGVNNPIEIVRNGEEALAYLSGSGEYSNREKHPLPRLVLLDLKMPKVDGFEVLQWIRTHPQLSGLPVVVLTSSENVRDVNRAYGLGANSFLVKPMDFNHFVELSSFISDHWFLWSKTPTTSVRAADDWEPRNKKVLLRDKQSRAFYAGYTAWVREKREALDFERIELA